MSALGLILFERCVTRRLGRASWPMYIAPACTAAGTIAAMTALETALPASVWLSAIIKALVCGVAFGSVIWVFDRAAALDAWRRCRTHVLWRRAQLLPFTETRGAHSGDIRRVFAGLFLVPPTE